MEKKIITISREFGSGGRSVGRRIAETLGMKVFLMTDCLINGQNRDLSGYHQGSFPELMAYVEQLRR